MASILPFFIIVLLKITNAKELSISLQIINEIHENEILTGSDFQIKCEVLSPGQSLNLIWKAPESATTEQTPIEYNNLTTSGILKILNVSPKDEGTYECQFEDEIVTFTLGIKAINGSMKIPREKKRDPEEDFRTWYKNSRPLRDINKISFTFTDLEYRTTGNISRRFETMTTACTNEPEVEIRAFKVTFYEKARNCDFFDVCGFRPSECLKPTGLTRISGDFPGHERTGRSHGNTCGPLYSDRPLQYQLIFQGFSEGCQMNTEVCATDDPREVTLNLPEKITAGDNFTVECLYNSCLYETAQIGFNSTTEDESFEYPCFSSGNAIVKRSILCQTDVENVPLNRTGYFYCKAKTSDSRVDEKKVNLVVLPNN